jgi:hypothetical protein
MMKPVVRESKRHRGRHVFLLPPPKLRLLIEHLVYVTGESLRTFLDE